MTGLMLKTGRLELMPLRLEQLEAIQAGSKPVEEVLGICVCDDLFNVPVRKALEVKIMRMRAEEASQHAWFTYWLMVLLEKQKGIGMAGFKGAPAGVGQVEIGYGISGAYEGQGYTTEAVRTLLGWAFSHPDCQSVVAETRKDNLASMRVLEKVGMLCYAETEEFFAWRLVR